MARIGLISDTHNQLYPAVWELLEGVERILHAGDVGEEQILTELETIAPVTAVPGNTDYPPLATRLPVKAIVDLPFGRVGLTHGHLVNAGRGPWPHALPEFFGEAATELAMIVYGHSHIAKLERSKEGIWLMNPGAAGRPRFNSRPTLALVHYGEPGAAPFRVEHLEIPIG